MALAKLERTIAEAVFGSATLWASPEEWATADIEVKKNKVLAQLDRAVRELDEKFDIEACKEYLISMVTEPEIFNVGDNEKLHAESILSSIELFLSDDSDNDNYLELRKSAVSYYFTKHMQVSGRALRKRDPKFDASACRKYLFKIAGF